MGGLSQAVDDLQRELITKGLKVEILAPGDPLPLVDLVHFHGLWQPAYLKTIANGAIPYVVSPHGMLEPWAIWHKAWKKWPYYYLFERRFLKGAACLFATGKMERDHLSALLPRHSIRTVSLGVTSEKGPGYIEARQKLGWSPERKVLLFLSRIHPKKGLHLLLQALLRLPASDRSDLRLVLIGGGEEGYLNKIKKFHKCHHDQLPVIEWIGEIWNERKWDYLQGADLFCLPTYSENFGLAILEALQVGTPVLTTDRTPWVEHRGEEGFYICRPEVDSIERQLMTYINNCSWSLGQRMELAGRISTYYSWKNIGSNYVVAYSEILRSAPRTN
jgi:glycosyltransferase involved in cell wall biosynthesis